MLPECPPDLRLCPDDLSREVVESLLGKEELILSAVQENKKKEKKKKSAEEEARTLRQVQVWSFSSPDPQDPHTSPGSVPAQPGALCARPRSALRKVWTVLRCAVRAPTSSGATSLRIIPCIMSPFD